LLEELEFLVVVIAALSLGKKFCSGFRSMEILPGEVLLQIFIVLQPEMIPEFDDIWTQDFSSMKNQWRIKNGPRNLITGSESRYHPTIQCSRGRPLLLLLSQVCKQWRKVVHLHPFWNGESFVIDY
jgi:hypothetical protein